jgi:hypothetical protein
VSTIKYVTKAGALIELKPASNLVTGMGASLSSLFDANALAQRRPTLKGVGSASGINQAQKQKGK